MFAWLSRAFRDLDTTEADAAIAAAVRANKDVQVRARALRMAVGCDDAASAVVCIAEKVTTHASHALRQVYDQTLGEPVPPALSRLIEDL